MAVAGRGRLGATTSVCSRHSVLSQRNKLKCVAAEGGVLGEDIVDKK